MPGDFLSSDSGSELSEVLSEITDNSELIDEDSEDLIELQHYGCLDPFSLGQSNEIFCKLASLILNPPI